MQVRTRIWLTLSLAALIGLAVALLVAPTIQHHRMLDAIGSLDAAKREAAWVWWATDAAGLPRAARSLEAINTRLDSLTSSDETALLDAADALRRLDLWGWHHQPESLLIRTIRLRTQQDDHTSQQMALALLRDAPGLREAAAVTAGMFTECIQPLLTSAHNDIARKSLDVAISWLAAHDPAAIAVLDLTGAPRSLQRTWLLACGIVGIEPSSEIESHAEPDLLEAALLARVLRSPDDTSDIIKAMRAIADDRFLPRASVLRHGVDTASWNELDRLAREGNRPAEYARQARSPNLEYEQAQQAFADANGSRGRRALAAWRLRQVDAGELSQLLDQPVSDQEGAVYSDVLLAERHLPRGQSTQLAEHWIRSFDDRRKRAGALLAALLGEHEDLLAEAYRVENIPAVRTIQYLALHAMGHAPEARNESSADPKIIAHRALYADRDDFDPDIALAMLIGGDQEALVLLTSPPRGDELGRSVQQRAWLIQRFAPDWHARLGRPIGGDLRGVVLHFDAMRAMRLSTARSLTFDEASRVFVQDVTATPRSTAAGPD